MTPYILEIQVGRIKKEFTLIRTNAPEKLDHLGSINVHEACAHSGTREVLIYTFMVDEQLKRYHDNSFTADCVDGSSLLPDGDAREVDQVIYERIFK